MTFNRAEMFWLAVLWCCDAWRLEKRRIDTELFAKAFAECGERLWEVMLRPSPLLERFSAPFMTAKEKDRA